MTVVTAADPPADAVFENSLDIRRCQLLMPSEARCARQCQLSLEDCLAEYCLDIYPDQLCYEGLTGCSLEHLRLGEAFDILD